MATTASGFDWDKGNRDKCQKHGVSIVDIEGMFARRLFMFPDVRHSGDEERFKAIGTGETGRHVLIVFMLRDREGETLIRPISARYMHQQEIAYHEEEAAKTENR